MRDVPEAPGGAKVLVVDDENEIRTIASESLRRHGFDVIEESDGRAALEVLRRTRLDLVVLDIGLPGLHGLDLLSELRRSSQLPVIILSGRSDESDRVLGLKMGADDYLTKPFSPRELVARVESVLRRSRPTASGRCLEFHDLVVDTSSREVTVRGEPVELTSREFDLLVHLASSPKRVYSRQQILREVWGSSSDWQQEATVTEHVRRVRQKIEQDAEHPRWIKTVRGVGYQFLPSPTASDGGGAEDDE